MPVYESIFLLLAAVGVWFWLDSLKAREIGIAAARQACADEDVQFLDDTVVGARPGLGRNAAGRLQLRRVFSFEYSDTGDNRRRGSVTLLGHEVELLHLRPRLHIIASSHETLH